MRIVLYDTLLQQCQESEVVAVLAHELGAPTFMVLLSALCISSTLWLLYWPVLAKGKPLGLQHYA